MFRYFKKLLTSFTLRLNTLLAVFLSLSHFTAIENALVCFLKDACSLSLQSQLKGVHTGFLLGKKKNGFSFFEVGVHVTQTALALPAYTSSMLQLQACTSLPPSQVVFLGAPCLQNFTAVLWVAWVGVTLRSKYLQYSF